MWLLGLTLPEQYDEHADVMEGLRLKRSVEVVCRGWVRYIALLCTMWQSPGPVQETHDTECNPGMCGDQVLR